MTPEVRQFRGLFEKETLVRIYRYDLNGLLDKGYFKYHLEPSDSLSDPRMNDFLEVASRAEEKGKYHVILSVNDSQRSKETPENAPLDGNAEPTGFDWRGFPELPKIRRKK